MDIFCTLVGTSFRGSEAKRLVNSMVPGDLITLLAEPTNAYDSSAVAGYFCGEHVGYLSRENNAEVAIHLATEGELTARVVDFESRKPVLLITL